MATVTGSLADTGIVPLDDAKVTLKFILSGGAQRGGRLVATRPAIATFTSRTEFRVECEPTDGMVPQRWYTVKAEWLDSARNFTEITLWKRVYVPEGGGDMGTFPGVPLRDDAVYVGIDPPPPGFKGWWLVSKPGNPATGTDTGSGSFRRVY